MINMRTEFLVEEFSKFDQKKSSELDQLKKKFQESVKKLNEKLEKKDFSNFILLSTIYGKE